MSDEPLPLNTFYEVTDVVVNPRRYGELTVELQRADGFGGSMTMRSGTELGAINKGKKYKITIVEVE